MKNIVSILLVLLACSCFSQEKKGEDLYKEAYALLEKEAYSEALDLFIKIEEGGLTSSEMQFNQGTAYLKLGNVAESVLYLERAFRADPSNADIRKNLSIARNMVDSDIVEIPDFILLRAWRAISGALSPLVWFGFELLLGILFVFGLYKWKFSSVQKNRLKGFAIGLISLGVFLIATFAGITSDRMAHQKDIGILMRSTDLHIGADERSDTLTYLSEGVKIKVKDKIGEWVKVQLINKEEGWLKVEDVEIL